MIFTLLQQLVIDLRNCIKSIKYFLYYSFVFLEHFQKSSKSESDLLVSLQFRNKSSVLPFAELRWIRYITVVRVC